MNETLKCTTHANGDIQEMLPFAMKLKKNVKGELNLRVFTWFFNLKFYVDLFRPNKAKMKEVFCNRNPLVPSVIRFHPYDPWLAVADKEGCT